MDIQNTIPLEPGGKDTCTPGRVFIGIRRACDNNLMFEDRVIAARGLGCTGLCFPAKAAAPPPRSCKVGSVTPPWVVISPLGQRGILRSSGYRSSGYRSSGYRSSGNGGLTDSLQNAD